MHGQVPDPRMDSVLADFFGPVDPSVDHIVQLQTYEVCPVSPDLPEMGLPTLCWGVAPPYPG